MDTASGSENNQQLLIKQKDYELLAIKQTQKFQVATQDPLINPPKKNKNKKGVIFDGKTILVNSNAHDPLSRISRIPQMKQKQKIVPQAIYEEEKLQITSWQTILGYFQKMYDYRADQYSVKIENVFGSQGVKQQQELCKRIGGSVTVRSTIKQSTISSKKNISNSQVNPTEQKKQKIMISLATCVKLILEMKKQQRQKWNAQDKQGSLQSTNQLLKVLKDTSNSKFQAVKFSHIIQAVQEFGLNVFERVKKLSFPNLSSQKIKQISIKDIQNTNIPEKAQQICKNWINKISSIRQLLPRVFIQATLLRLRFFIDNGEQARKILKKLAKSNRCFGEYINCIFFSTFLIRIGNEVLPQEKDFILDILDDVFFYIKQGKKRFCPDDIDHQQFFRIIEPFFIFSFESLSQSMSRQNFKRICQILPQNPHPVILKNFINSFSPSLLVYYSVDIVRILQKVQGMQKLQIYKILLDRLSGVVFPQSGQLIVLVWSDISELRNLEVLLDLLAPFSEIIFKNVPRYEKNRFYSLILETFNNLFYNFGNTDKNTFDSFQKFLVGILEKTQDIQDIITLEPFLQIISYFPIKNKREISQSISKAFLLRQSKITDPVIVHILLSLMKNMQGLPVKEIALDFTSKVDFGSDFEQTLSFLAEMRSIFGYIPQVITALIYKAIRLTFTARKNAKGRITKKLVSFLQATLAYCFITVPVIEDPKLKLKLYLYLSEIALANNLISQATSLIKTCITQLSQTQLESDIHTYQIFHRIISFLIVMPDDPQSDYLLLFNGLYQAFTLTKLKTNLQYIIRFQFLTQCIVYISCQAQQKLPFHIEGVVSNDGLFKSTEFRIALVSRIHEIFQDLQKLLKNIANVEGPQIDGYVLKNLLSCVMTLTSYFQTTPRFTKLIVQLVKILQKIRSRVAKDVRNQKKYLPALKGLKTRLQECGIQAKFKD